MLTSSEIRQQFIDFFVKKHGHTFVPSSPVVPHDDPTLLFTNAGMNQFKDVFLGTGSRSYKRAANTQKCIRAGGKHNDLDDVGKDTYHHTFFEMLGNWSFGDYFKKEAIAWAWELLTDVWKMDKSRLHVTVFEGDPENGVPRDDEAAEHWKSVGVPPERIHLGNKKDNFWEMGETGPCGPCTEIHYDHTPDKSGASLVNKGSDKVIEIWNLVFIQFNRNPDRSLTPLPAKHVDTGMGFERVVKVLQGKNSNYDTDVFIPLFEAIQKVTGAAKYTGSMDDLKDIAYRVIADHIRTLTFALTDGEVPSNNKRGSVLRSVLRRAERYGKQYLGAEKPFLHELVPVVVTLMGGAFPELLSKPQGVAAVIQEEEADFLRTFDRGLRLYRQAVEQIGREGRKVLDAKTVFTLHTAQGFFSDITDQMASEDGLVVDRQGFEQLMAEHRTISDQGRTKVVVAAVQGELPQTDDSFKYCQLELEAKVVGWVKDNVVTTTGMINAPDELALLLDRTAFYSEQGGQVGDSGTIVVQGQDQPQMLFNVRECRKLDNAVLHIGTLIRGAINAQDPVFMKVASPRFNIMKNHTATHLLNLALRQVLGNHVEQKGSLVDAEKTRFDFSHDRPITPDEIHQVEAIVNQQIQLDLPVKAKTMPLAEAKNIPGVRAVFGEKYPDPVRVLMIGAEKPEEVTPEMSVEFCGGTHLSRTSQAGLFKIIGQELVSKGVRRITAVTGPKAIEYVQKTSAILDELTSRFNCRFDELPARVATLQEQVKELTKSLQKGMAGDLNAAGDKLLEAAVTIGASKLIVGEVPPSTVEQLRAQIDRLRQKAGSSLIVFGWKTDEGGGGFLVGVTDDLVKKGIKAGDIIKPVAEVAGGKGGGPPNMATAGCKDPSKLATALAHAVELGKAALNR